MTELEENTLKECIDCNSESTRKKLGQYFTNSVVSNYMASLLKPVHTSTIRTLDAGAGTGILTTSVAARCLEFNTNHFHAVLYEIDENMNLYLKRNMQKISKEYKKQGKKFSYEIRNEDFVLSRPDQNQEPFHFSSINPPYFKYNSKTSPYANATTDLYNGNPNIYASFMAVVAASLAPNGQMVAIVPRSFTNGLYFKGFRQYLLNHLNLERIHIFKSRNVIFKQMKVLQENVIFSFINTKQGNKIKIHSSNGYEDLTKINTNTYSTELLIDSTNNNYIIRIPELISDAHILAAVEQWPSSFEENNYFISTGPVVEHRTREYITSSNDTNTIPLFKMHNVKPFVTDWSGEHKKDVRFILKSNHKKHTLKNQTFVILKRFSSKDEKKRLIAGVHNSENTQDEFLALENHLNYIGHQNSPLSKEEAYGLTILFNSTVLDVYFRCISGNTQVNATEIRLLKLPTRGTIKTLGKHYMSSKITTQDQLDSLVNKVLRIKAR